MELLEILIPMFIAFAIIGGVISVFQQLYNTFKAGDLHGVFALFINILKTVVIVVVLIVVFVIFEE